MYFLYAVTLSEHLRVTNTWGDNAHHRMLLCIDGGMQADKEGQCMQRRGGTAQLLCPGMSTEPEAEQHE